MYKRVLLAYDGSLEGRTALREGALLARQCGAQVFLLAVLVDTGMSLLADVAHAGAFVQMENAVMEVLNEGVARLRQPGFDPVAKLGRGEPAKVIGTFARRLGLISSSWAIGGKARLTAGGQAPGAPISLIIRIAVYWLPAI